MRVSCSNIDLVMSVCVFTLNPKVGGYSLTARFANFVAPAAPKLVCNLLND